MITKLACSLAFMALCFSTSAQTGFKYTLQQCIDTALAKNVEVRQSGLLTEAASVNWKQARANQLPDLNSSVNHGINQGRSIDPFTNGYVNQAINYAGYSLNSGVIVFNGLNLRNQVKRNATAYDASRAELQQDKDNLTLNIIVNYLQVLNNEDQLASSMRQKELSARQLERLMILDSLGAISPIQLSDLKGQIMNDQLSILEINNAVETSKLNLSQLMNIPYNPNMKLERIDVEEFLTEYGQSAQEVFETALRQFSLVRSVELRKKSADYALKSSRGALFPSLVLGGSLQSNYSSIAQNSMGKISYDDQIRNNIFSSINLGLRVPILNAFRTRYTIRLADINLRNTELEEEGTKLQLRKDIDQAHLTMITAYERYKTLAQQVEAYTISFRGAEAKFNTGVGTSVDYLVAKNNLDRANINLISAKYNFVLRKRILDYYQKAMN